MNLKCIVLVLWCFSGCYCATTRIWHHKNSCSKPGFTCLPRIGSKTTLIYECPSKLREYHIYINEFNGPKTLENLIIRNCKTLTVLFRCSKYAWEKKNMKYLQISDIQKLKFMIVPKHQSVLPPTVVFENITSIENIPSYMFTQTRGISNEARCSLPNYKLSSLSFRNVTIGKVQPNAINLENIENITFSKVKIDEMSPSALKINQNPKGSFTFEDGEVNHLNDMTFVITGPKVVFRNNVLNKIPPNSLQIQSSRFIFSNNSVLSMKKSSVKIVSEEVVISFNQIGRFQSEAISLIGDESGIDRATFEFTENEIDYVEDGGVISSLITYNHITIRKNTFSCECSKAGFLLSKIAREHQDQNEKIFYEKLFDEQSENRCTSSCNLPLSAAREKFLQGKCVDSITVDDICDMRKTKVPTWIPSISSSSSSWINPTTVGNYDQMLTSTKHLLQPDTENLGASHTSSLPKIQASPSHIPSIEILPTEYSTSAISNAFVPASRIHPIQILPTEGSSSSSSHFSNENAGSSSSSYAGSSSTSSSNLENFRSAFTSSQSTYNLSSVPTDSFVENMVQLSTPKRTNYFYTTNVPIFQYSSTEEDRSTYEENTTSSNLDAVENSSNVHLVFYSVLVELCFITFCYVL